MLYLDNDELGEEFLKDTFAANKEQEDSLIKNLRQMAADIKTPAEGVASANNFKPRDRPTTPTMILMEEAGQVNTNNPNQGPSLRQGRQKAFESSNKMIEDGPVFQNSLPMGNGGGQRV